MIVEASEPLPARLVADTENPGIDATFAGGHALEREQASLVPARMIGRLLDEGQAGRLLERIDVLASKKPPAPSVRRRAVAGAAPGAHEPSCRCFS